MVLYYDFDWHIKYKEKDKEYITYDELVKEGFDNKDIENMKEWGMLIPVGRIKIPGSGLICLSVVTTLFEFKEIY